MKKLQITILIAFVLGMMPIQSFTQSTYKPLKVGDKVPDDVFTHLDNYKTKSAKLSDFDGKLLILDFWNLGCAPCIASWPKLLKLQKEFEGKIQIVLVNPDQDSKSIMKFIEHKKKNQKIDMNLPSFSKDCKLKHLFPVTAYPTIIWIDDKGIVRSISGGSSLTSENIKKMLNGEDVKMPQYTLKSKSVEVVYEKPFYLDGNCGDGSHMLWYSVVSRYNDGIQPAMGIFADEKVGYFITKGNSPILEMVRFLFNENTENFTDRLPLSRISLEVSDTTRFYNFVDGEYRAQNQYTYQLFSRVPTTKAWLKKTMKNDLERYFGINLNWEIREIDCLVLRAKDSLSVIYKPNMKLDIKRFNAMDEGLKKKLGITNYEGLNKALCNWKMSNLLLMVKRDYYNSAYPIFEETGVKGKLNPNFVFSLFSVDKKDLKAFNQALRKYKMSFKFEKRKIKMMIITEQEDYIHIEREITEEEKAANDRYNKKRMRNRIARIKDVNEFKKQLIKFINTYYLDDWNELNSAAWALYQHPEVKDKETLEQGIVWVKKSIELDNNYFNTDTYAHLLYKIGRKKEALIIANKAIELASKADKKIDPKATKELIEKIKAN